MKRQVIAIIALATALAAQGAFTVKFGSEMDVEIDGEVQTFAKNAIFDHTAVPCVYKMRPTAARNGRTFCIASNRHESDCRFPQYGDGNWVRVALAGTNGAAITITGSAAGNVYYADAEHGNDEWDGTADYEHRDETAKKGPKQSLQAAHDAAEGTNPIVLVAPGVYSNGVTEVSGETSGVTYTSRRRLSITKAIGFIATDGAEKTFIVGARDPSTENGMGDNAVCGVYCAQKSGTYAYFQGFTITGCYSLSNPTNYRQYGLALCSGAYRAHAIDCVISNNVAGRYVATAYSTFRRTKIIGNETGSGVSYRGVFGSCLFAGNRITGSDATSTAAAACTFDNSSVYFCTVDLRSPLHPNGRKAFANTGTTIGTLVIGYAGTAIATSSSFFDNVMMDGRLLADADGYDYRVGMLSPAIDAVTYDGLTVAARLAALVDIDGRAPVLHGGKMRAGAVWNEPALPVTAIAPADGRLSVVGANVGTNIVTAANEVTVTATTTDPHPFLGFEVNGEMMPPTSRTYSFIPSIAAGAVNSVRAVYDNNWYVDCVNGDDANPGTEALPKQTIRAATTNAVSGDVIHVAPGTYGALEGSQKATAASKIGTRVVIPEGVTIESTGGAENTFIVGAEATGDQIDIETYKTGTNAVRCVYANNNAKLRGFTLTGGHGIGADKDGVNGQGAAFYSASARSATIENCIVSNNFANYATIYAANVRGCRVTDNWGLISGTGTSGSAGYACNWYSCVIARNRGNATLHRPIRIENCTIASQSYAWESGTAQVLFYNNVDEDRAIVNSVVLGGRFYFTGSGKLCITNCLFRPDAPDKGNVLREENAYNTRFSVPASELTVDADFRPVLGSFVGIDTGDASVSSASLGDKDALGTPRILNGAIDVGAVEYDWRPTFAQELGRRFKVTYASPTVTTNETGGVLIPADCGTLGSLALPRCIAGTSTATGPYEFRFQLEGGLAEVFVGGVLAGEASGTGERSIRFNVTDTADEIRFVFTPDVEDVGSAILRALSRAAGFSVTFR